MNNIFINILYHCSVISFLIPLIPGIGYFKRLDRQMKLLVFLMMAEGITELTTYYLVQILERGFHWVHHLYFPVEYAIFALIFSRWIKSRIYSQLVLYSIFVILIFAVFNSLFLQSLNQLNSYVITMGLIFYTGFTLYVLYQIMNEDMGRILKNNKFWVATGLLIFSAGDLAYFAFYPLVNQHYLIAIWAIHAILNITVHIFYSVGIICQGRKWE